MREFRLKALETYNKMSIPNWGPSLEGLDMSNIVTYVRPNTEMRGKWSDVPEDIKNTFERLGIPQAERSSLAGVGAQVRLRGRLSQRQGGSRRPGCCLHRHGERPDRPLRRHGEGALHEVRAPH